MTTPGRASRDRGETLVEGLVAIGIIGLVLVALVGLVGTALGLGSLRDAQSRSDLALRGLYESVTAYHAAAGGPLTCDDAIVVADIQRIVASTPMPDGVSAAPPEVYVRYLPATSGSPVAVTSGSTCPSAVLPSGSVPLGLSVTLRVTVAAAGRGGSWSDTMTAYVGRSS